MTGHFEVPVFFDSLRITGLEMIELVGRGAHSLVYRARRGDRDLAVKIQNPEVRTSLRREAAILGCLSHPGLASLVALGQVEGQNYLVMEYVEGPSLATLLRHGPLDEPRIIAAAQQLAGALAEVHRHGLVHRDITPKNIILDPKVGAKLVDFGFATRARDRALSGREDIVGTFLYCAPEQSGMLHRAVDGRSDLYALGCVLFECAAGHPPFTTNDVGELLHQHAVVPPPEVRALRPDLSLATAAIVGKLLAKDPDDRYQTAEGLVADLKNLTVLNDRLLEGDKSVLASADAPAPVLAEPPFIGRQVELAALVDHWRRALGGTGGMVLIEGDAGVGKTRLVRELRGRVEGASSLRLVGGRCSKDPGLPFAPFREAIDNLAAEVALMPPQARTEAERRLRDAAKGFTPALSKVSQRVAELLGHTPEKSALAASDDVLYDAIAAFLIRIAKLTAVPLIFIDDAQWMDEDSHQVLRRLALAAGKAPVLIVLAGRNDPERGGLERLISEIAPACSARIKLAPFDELSLSALLGAQLGDRAVDPRLVNHVAVRSSGNPLAASEYLRAMIDAGVVWPSWDGWLFDEAELTRLRLPQNLVEIILKRIATLSTGTRNLLTTAAVWGESFPAPLLPDVSGGEESLGAVYAAVLEASAARLIERTGKDTHAFVHHRVREALLASLDPAERKRRHQMIAERLSARGASGDELFELAGHYARGEREKDPRAVYQANLAAGARALENHANRDALAYLKEAFDAAALAGIEPEAELTEALGEAYARTGAPDAARTFLEQTLSSTREPLQEARLRARLASVRLDRSELELARAELRRGFSALGRRPPSLGLLELILVAWLWFRSVLLGRLVRETAAPKERERLRVLIQLHELQAKLAFWEGRPRRALLATIRGLSTARRLGPSRELARSQSNYAAIITLLGWRRTGRIYAVRALELAKALEDRGGIARSMAAHAWVKNLSGAAREAEILGRRVLEEHGAWLDVGDYLYACSDLAWNLLLRGYAREAWSWIQRAEVREDLARDPGSADRHVVDAYAGSILAFLGKPEEAEEHLARYKKFLDQLPPERYRQSQLLSHRLLSLVERGILGEPLETLLAQHRDLDLSSRTVALQERHFWVGQAYARLYQTWSADQSQRLFRLGRLEAALAELERAATVPILRAHLLAVRAGYEELRGRHEDANHLLGLAEELAREVDSPWVLYEVSLQRAHAIQKRGNATAALREAQIAHDLAVAQGWPQRAESVRRQYPISTFAPVSSSVGTSTEVSSVNLQRQLDALMKVSLQSAAITDADEQIRVALDHVLRILRAERAFLFLTGGERGELVLRAARNDSGSDLREGATYSRTVVETVRATERPLVVSGTEDGLHLSSDSVITNALRNIMAAPMFKGDRLVGVIYLDTRLARGIFGEENLEILVAIANHLYVTLEATRTAQLEVYHRISANVPGVLFRMLVRTDGSWGITFLSRAARELFGGDPDSFIAHPERIVDALHTEDRRSFRDSLLESAAALAPWSWEGRTSSPQRPRWLRGAARPDRLTSGDTLIDGILIDITERCEAEQALEQAVHELARTTVSERERAKALEEAHVRLMEANRTIVEEQAKLLQAEKLSSIGRLAAGVAHEINNPLTGVMACVAAVRGGEISPDRHAEYFETICDGLERMKAVVQSLLDFAAPHAMEFAPVDVAQLVVSTLRLVAPELSRRRVRPSVRPHAPQVYVLGNRSQLMQAFMNVLLNAIYVSPKGGEVRISTRRDGDLVGIRIADRGPGIPQELIDRVCDPFFTTKPQGEGTGLGLAVTLGIMQVHKGELKIESRVGHGTRVTLWLPSADTLRAPENTATAAH